MDYGSLIRRFLTFHAVLVACVVAYFLAGWLFRALRWPGGVVDVLQLAAVYGAYLLAKTRWS